MKTIKSLFIFCSLFSSFLVSCDSMLDQPPLDQVSNDAYWKTASDLKNYIVQFYPGLVSGGYTSNYGTDATSGSDDAISKNTENITLNGARSISTNSSTSVWSWTTISNINTFFDNYKKCTDDKSLWSQYLGEAYFFRAWNYFAKVKDYGDVPIYRSTLSMTSPELYNPREKRTIVVDSIIRDLDSAIVNLKYLNELSSGSNSLSKEAALAFKSRVALYEGSWQKYHKLMNTPFATEGADPNKYFTIARDAALELMTNKKYRVGIVGTSADDYGKMFGLDDMSKNNEIILWKGFKKSLGLQNDLQAYSTKRTDGRAATMEFVESFLGKDGQPFDCLANIKTVKGNNYLNYLKENADPRLAQTLWMPGDLLWNNSFGVKNFDKPYLGQTDVYLCATGFQIKKGSNPYSVGAGSDQAFGSETGLIAFRYAEVLLNYAEAQCELGETVDYSISLNLLRKRVGMPNFDKTIHDPNAKRFCDYGYPVSDELFEIRRERRVELGQEGFRKDDYRRWAAHKLFQGKRPLGYPFLASEFTAAIGKKVLLNSDGLIDHFKTRMPNGYQFDENRDYLSSIPTNEITLNPNLKPNPGWE